MEPAYDALLMVGFGGPEKRDDVLPFLENVLRGKNVPRERILEVASHYEHFDGVSPINDQMRALLAALRRELAQHDIHLPIFWGNRNWHPMLSEAVEAMVDTGVKRVLAYVASAYSSYSGCRQYLEDIERARAAVGDQAPPIDKLRAFFNHPLFITASAERLQTALAEFPVERRAAVQVIFTAHSIPLAMARTCDYERQLRETCRLTAEAAGLHPDGWGLAFQSRSGRPEDPWLEPDILDELRACHEEEVREVAIMPIGFLSDHVEVLYDLDHEARHRCDELGMGMVRAATVGTHPLFVRMIRELIEERLSGDPERAAIGRFPARPDVCPADCCPAPVRATRAPSERPP